MPFTGRPFSNTIRRIVVVLAVAGILGGASYRYRQHLRRTAPLSAPAPGLTSTPPAAADASTAIATSAFPGWEIKPWGEPIVRRAAKGIVLEARGKPGGLFFKKSLDAETTYRVSVHGRTRRVVPSLRLHADGGGQVYYSLGTGDLNVILPRAKHIELLLYQDGDYSFDLQAVRVEPCPRCPSDADLKTRIIKEARIAPSDLSFVLARKLRNWVADAVVQGGEPVNMERTTRAVVTLPVSQTYAEIFKPGRGGVSCAGYAAFYQKVLRLFELPSFTIDVGWDNGSKLTHVTTVLVLGSPEQRRFYIFDPTFSGEYVRQGQAVEALDLLKGAKADFRTAPMSRRVLIPHSQLRSGIVDNEAAQTHAACDRESPLPEMTECHGFMDTPAYNAIIMGPAMEQSGFAPGDDFILGLMKHKILGILPSDLDQKAHLEFLHRAEQIGIPIPKFYRAS
jgi:hypothetical protein